MAIRNFIWHLRGVTCDNYRSICGRCGKTGQLHWGFSGCWRWIPVELKEFKNEK